METKYHILSGIFNFEIKIILQGIPLFEVLFPLIKRIGGYSQAHFSRIIILSSSAISNGAGQIVREI